MPFDGTQDIHRERRERAAALIRSMPPNQFNMRSWRRKRQDGTPTFCGFGWLIENGFEGANWPLAVCGLAQTLSLSYSDFCSLALSFSLTQDQFADALLAAPYVTKELAHAV